MPIEAISVLNALAEIGNANRGIEYNNSITRQLSLHCRVGEAEQ